jgi:hypothetical protein
MAQPSQWPANMFVSYKGMECYANGYINRAKRRYYFEQSVHTNCLGRKNSCWLHEWEESSSSSAIHLMSRAEWERGSGRVYNYCVLEKKSKDYSKRYIPAVLSYTSEQEYLGYTTN